jgi:dipeptidase D
LSREAVAVVAYPERMLPVLPPSWMPSILAAFRTGGVDEGITVLAESASASTVLDAADQAAILAALHAAPHGVSA